MGSHQVDSSSEPTVAAPEAAPDSAPDAAQDSAPDTALRSAPDATQDSAPDTALRSAPDAAQDSVPDTALRSAPDAVPETASRSAPNAAPGNQHAVSQHDNSTLGKPSILSASGISSWARSLRNLKQSGQGNPESENAGMSSFARFTKEFGSRLSSKFPAQDETVNNSTTNQPGGMGSITKGLMDSSLSAVKSVQVKARHVVSQNKRRYQEGGFDLDMTYITHNIIAMGFPAGDMSSGLLGYVEGFYRNHMEEVIKFFETHHKAKYKVYNLCSERLYDAALFQGKVASFPFDDHNCPPIHLIPLFCQSASSWLKEDNDNVIAVHCKAGMARTGLMISSLLLFLKLFPTAEESMYYYNQKRCIDGKGLVLPSQIRYVKYFERILTQFNGDIPPGRRCMLRGFRLLHCPYWIRPSITISNHTGILFSTKRHPKTKHLMPEDFWFSSKKKGIVVFALPAEPGLTELAGDFKIHFHDRQGDFYCWLNTTMMEDRMTLTTSDLDDFNKRSIPAPGFQVQILMVDPDAKRPTSTGEEFDGKSVTGIDTAESIAPPPAAIAPRDARTHDNDDVFSDSEPEGSEPTKSRHAKMGSSAHAANAGPETTATKEGTQSIGQGTERVSLRNPGVTREATSIEQKYKGNAKSSSVLETSKTEFKPVAADASVFSFGDEDEFDSD